MTRHARQARIIQRLKSKAFRSCMRRGCIGCYSSPAAVIEFVPAVREKFGMDENQALYAPVCAKCLDNGIDLSRLEEAALWLFGLGGTD